MIVALAVLPIASAADPDPAELRVTVNGDRLSYEVVNLSPYRIVGFQIYSQFTSGGYENLGCGVSAQVKSPKDLVLRDVCTVPRDAKTGKLVGYTPQIQSVEFANRTKWSPARTSNE